VLPVSLSGGLVMEAILRGGESGVRVGSYIRLSEETEGMQLGLQRQREANEKTAADRCWQITREYEDAGVSAYKRRVVRPGFEQLLTDLASGLIDGICVWDSDRLARQPRDLERLIDLYETRKGLVFATANKDVDLSTSDGRFYARLMVNVANKSSADSGRRIAAKHLQLAQAGVPVGGNRPFGWQVDKRTINEEEAALIRQAARDVIAGVGIHTIVRQWNRAGVRTTKDNLWQHQVMRQMLLNPRLAGFRVYRGELFRDADGQPVRGQFPAVLDVETWEYVVATITARKHGIRLGARKYLLSGIARCGECSRQLHGNRGHGSFFYKCEQPCGRVSMSGPKLDGLVEEFVRQKLAEEMTDEPYESEPESDNGLQEVLSRKAELMKAYTKGELSAETVFPAVQQLEARAKELRQAQIARVRQHSLKIHQADLAYDELDTDQKRAVIGTIIRYIVVNRAEGRGGKFNPERVTITWND
jgi:site-specific DNA recombinase